MTVYYSPISTHTDQIMKLLATLDNIHVIGVNNTNELEQAFIAANSASNLAGIEFTNHYTYFNMRKTNDLSIALRFPGETRLKIDPSNVNTWRTNLVYPSFQTTGPREVNYESGGSPSKCHRYPNI